MKKHIQVTLIIPTYYQLMKLFRFLKSLIQLTPLPDEVIIIDDRSTDQTPELLKRWKDFNNRICKKIVLKDQNKGSAHPEI